MYIYLIYTKIAQISPFQKAAEAIRYTYSIFHKWQNPSVPYVWVSNSSIVGFPVIKGTNGPYIISVLNYTTVNSQNVSGAKLLQSCKMQYNHN